MHGFLQIRGPLSCRNASILHHEAPCGTVGAAGRTPGDPECSFYDLGMSLGLPFKIWWHLGLNFYVGLSLFPGDVVFRF